MKKNKLELFQDFLDFIHLCNQHEVKYLIIGGYAVSLHGYPRSTKDLDICIQLSKDNAIKMLKVIDDFGFGSLGLKEEDFLKEHYITQLGHEPLRIDILNDLDGVPFNEAWENKHIVTIQNIKTNFIGYHELLKVKQKAGRKQDIADIEKLRKRNER